MLTAKKIIQYFKKPIQYIENCTFCGKTIKWKETHSCEVKEFVENSFYKEYRKPFNRGGKYYEEVVKKQKRAKDNINNLK